MLLKTAEIYAIIHLSHKLNSWSIWGIFCFKGYYTLFCAYLNYGLGKNANSSNLDMAEILLFRLVCVTTIGVCVFRCT